METILSNDVTLIDMALQAKSASHGVLHFSSDTTATWHVRVYPNPASCLGLAQSLLFIVIVVTSYQHILRNCLGISGVRPYGLQFYLSHGIGDHFLGNWYFFPLVINEVTKGLLTGGWCLFVHHIINHQGFGNRRGQIVFRL